MTTTQTTEARLKVLADSLREWTITPDGYKRHGLHTEVRQLLKVERARPDITTIERAFLDAAEAVLDGTSSRIPEPPIARYFAQPKAFDLLGGEERLELGEAAKGIAPEQAAEALQMLEMQEMSGDSALSFGLSDAERAAALVLRDDQRFTSAIEKVQNDLDADRRRRA